MKTIKYNFILDQRGTLIPQSNLICDVLCEYLQRKLDVSCLKWNVHKWLPSRGSNADSFEYTCILLIVLYDPFIKVLYSYLECGTSSWKLDLNKFTWMCYAKKLWKASARWSKCINVSFIEPLTAKGLCERIWLELCHSCIILCVYKLC